MHVFVMDSLYYLFFTISAFGGRWKLDFQVAGLRLGLSAWL